MTLDASVIKFIYENLHNPFLDNLMLLIAKISQAGLVWVVITIALLFTKQYRRVGLMAATAFLRRRAVKALV